MTVTSQWESLIVSLRDFAPLTAASFQSGASTAEIDAAEAALGVRFPAALREWVSVQNGQINPDDGYAGELLPRHQFFSLDQVLTEHATLLSISNEMANTNPDVYDSVADMSTAAPEAGTQTDLFIPAYVPISGAEDIDNFCDTRSGAESGCVRLWAYDDGPAGPPIWPSISEMLAEVEQNIVEGPPDGWRIAVDDGVMHWEVDSRDDYVGSLHQSIMNIYMAANAQGRVRSAVPQEVLDSDGVDLLAVQRDILERVTRTYGEGRVTDIFLGGNYLPRFVGSGIWCVVAIDGVPATYTATATDTDGGYVVTESAKPDPNYSDERLEQS